ncbi:hypothetical protein T552_03110 [Pneumocystis carinii B80]|uniref:Inositol-pentakisphosphate 2-kinase n=1 Tax=Pneumocystis carinii (strain B80) TaxID=1408658 RepID=A0A0W4ZBZ8_PNEC8|nr:hypothetical protein T552_03110 [Pneumocystis carinii B80]KTW25838.1 hypothetical protein T552_03110 [Pneumocystis carinii B80]
MHHPVSTLENINFIQKVVTPLFHKPFDRYILTIKPIMLENVSLEIFNIHLTQKNRRKKKYENTLLDINETHAILLRDLSSDFPKSTIEFKPKWLNQSILAPNGWKSCRTCALRRFRGDLTINGIRYCPLDLASGNKARIQKSVRAILIKNHIYNQNIETNLSLYFQQSQLIDHLKYLQTNSSRTLSMTFCDCTIYVIFLHEEIFDIKILDLDCKPETKAEYWDKMEGQLIDENWYLGRGMIDNEEPCRL